MQFVVKGRSHHASGYLPYLQYLEHLRTRMPAPKEHENFEAPYLGEDLGLGGAMNVLYFLSFSSSSRYCFCRQPHWPTSSTTAS